ncbi:hypothetical protein A8L34_29540 [Bacillus sp. FJAT-27264]|uniref:hypothetical protein n=1 Tax=Paenibacillus sp. (strain DSM 101736 / FJAT-27264) TaxID=1850362 RepID=UPI000807E9A4|nr:hypothetical protein [Bacillus sp. FJAT-27264]OBZ15204.1 hypothetical protein A8L34_29540 [Bacillus sp. FJAT-27264]
MNKIAQIKLVQNLKGMKTASEQSGELLKYIEQEISMTDELREAFSNVVKHNNNMIRFLGVLQDQLQKK